MDSVTVSGCNIGVGFCLGHRQLSSILSASTAHSSTSVHCSCVTARCRRSDELAFYGRYHALVGHIMAAKTRPAGMTNRLFIDGKPPV